MECRFFWTFASRGINPHVLRTLTLEQRGRCEILLREIVAEYRDIVPRVGQVHCSSGVIVRYCGQGDGFPDVGLTRERFVPREEVDLAADDHRQVCKEQRAIRGRLFRFHGHLHVRQIHRKSADANLIYGIVYELSFAG